jgi:hypothetical protein
VKQTYATLLPTLEPSLDGPVDLAAAAAAFKAKSPLAKRMGAGPTLVARGDVDGALRHAQVRWREIFVGFVDPFDKAIRCTNLSSGSDVRMTRFFRELWKLAIERFDPFHMIVNHFQTPFFCLRDVGGQGAEF